MSYEGYRQILCENGHYHTEDAYASYWDDNECPWKCSICGSKEAWSNGVDTTNGSFDYDPTTGAEVRIDGFVDLEIDQPAVMCKCSCCGNEHMVQAPRYKIPTKTQ